MKPHREIGGQSAVGSVDSPYRAAQPVNSRSTIIVLHAAHTIDICVDDNAVRLALEHSIRHVFASHVPFPGTKARHKFIQW